MAELIERELSEAVIGAAIEVHRELGPGLLESVYESCLAHELESRGIEHRRQVSLPVRYKSQTLDIGYRLDLLVNDRLIVEVKSVDRLEPVHEAQLLTYLKLSDIRVGLLVNFNVPVLTKGIVRRVL